MGWALKSSRPRTEFTPEQIDFMTEKFNIGLENADRKQKPQTVAAEMRQSGKFTSDKFLRSQQIANFWTRINNEYKKGTRKKGAPTPQEVEKAKADVKKDTSPSPDDEDYRDDPQFATDKAMLDGLRKRDDIFEPPDD